MGRNKTTGTTTKPYSFRLNPAYPQDKDAIDMIEHKTREGYSMRQIMTDAILFASNHTPEMYAQYGEEGSQPVNLEAMLSAFAQDIIKTIEQRMGSKKKTQVEEVDGSEDQGQWVKTLTKGFIARQQQVMEDDEDE